MMKYTVQKYPIPHTEAIRLIAVVGKRRFNHGIPQMMWRIADYVLSQEELDYFKLMHYIDSLRPTKMSGLYAFQDQALSWLKELLKEWHKKDKGTPKGSISPDVSVPERKENP